MLSTRISHVRTWTFIANRADWLEAPVYWQGRAKEIEDRLSDVLHERLTHRFIDRKTSVLMRRLAKREGLMSSVEEDGVIAVEGEAIRPDHGVELCARSGGGGKRNPACSRSLPCRRWPPSWPPAPSRFRQRPTPN